MWSSWLRCATTLTTITILSFSRQGTTAKPLLKRIHIWFQLSSPAVIEVDLKVRGATESEHEDLSFLVAPVACFSSMYSLLLNYACISKLSTLEFTLGHVVSSVEASHSRVMARWFAWCICCFYYRYL